MCVCVRVRGRERGAWKEREAGSLSEKQEREREREIVFYVLFSMFSVLVDKFYSVPLAFSASLCCWIVAYKWRKK